MAQPVVKLRPVAAELRMHNVRTRMTPKYGATILVACPLAHLWLTCETESGARVTGLAGDSLPPGWYDKRPGRTYRQDVEDLSAAVAEAQRTVLDLGRAQPRSVSDLWRDLYKHQLEWARARDLPDLVGNLGTSLFERALIDAAGKHTNAPFHKLVSDNLLGLEPEAVHPFLNGWRPAEALAERPRSTIHVRHTVGGVDPLTEGDVAPGKRLRDGLPQTLEDYLRAEKLRYFKLKLGHDSKADLQRLGRIARLLDEHIPAAEPYFVTLDGNEQCDPPEALTAVLEQLKPPAVSERFAAAVLFVEQPYPRAKTLDESVRMELARTSRIKPVIIDESDANLESVPRALELGYAGYAIKSAKGPLKAIFNKAAVQRHPSRPARGIVSGEDMMNVPVLPLHTDLVVMAALGVEHVERNGHHFCRGLDHLAPGEREALLKGHPRLYRKFDDSLTALDTERGTLDVTSLNARPGFGVDASCEMDGTRMTPWADWKFESLGL
ncbi:MAG: hypothetical protein HS116_11425 [Planctomycetes bacterium]|nr:hypothetical protein [Planctomycetota bacterium]